MPERPEPPRAPVVALLVAAVVAVALGLLAVVADKLPGPLGRILLIFASTGLSWGGAAFVFGAKSRRRAVAVAGGTMITVGAVITYYAGSAMINSRPAAVNGSLLAAGKVWGALALVAGPVLGGLGWYAVRTSGRARSAAWGVLAGLLLSQGVYLLTRTRDNLLDPDAGALRPLLAVGLLVPVVLVVVGSRRRHLGVAFAAMAVVGAVGAFAWSLVMRAV